MSRIETGSNIETTNKREHEPSQETWRLTVPYITTSGTVGSGKSSTIERLIEKYNYKIRQISTGDIFRSLQKQEVVGFAQRPKSLDRELDEVQIKALKTATVEDPLVLDGKLAGYFASMQENPQGVSILFVADSRVRAERVRKRFIKNTKGRIQNLEASKKEKKLTKDEILELKQLHETPYRTLEEFVELNRERQNKDSELWHQMYPDSAGINFFQPGVKNKKGKPIYQYVISTTKSTIEETVDALHKWLVENGYSKKIEPEKTARTESPVTENVQGDIFTSPSL